MSVVQNTLIGRSRQAIGNAVFTTWKGINVLKSKPISVENPNTINQQMRRSALSQTVAFFRAISNVVLVGFKELAVGKSEYNAFSSEMLRVSFDYTAPPVATIQANSILISKGTIATQPITTSTASGATNAVTINWSSAVLQPGQATTDKALVVIFNSTTATLYGEVTSVSRSANTAVITDPNGITVADVLEVYLGFYNPTSGKSGDSQYINVVAGA